VQRIRTELKALRKSFDELEASRECLKKDHEDLEIAHTRLKEDHSTLLELVKEKDIMLEKLKKKAVEEKVIMTCDIELTCDLIDDSIIVESTNPSCSTSTSACLLKSLGSQRFSLNKEGLGYTPKKGKATFVTPKPSFVKSNGWFCNRCKQVGHVEHNCTKINKNKLNTNVPYIHFDSCYVLTKGEKGVHAKFVGTPIVGPKKKVI
jgi:hypothetical protein